MNKNRPHMQKYENNDVITFSFNEVIAFENSSVAFSNSLTLNASFPFSFNTITAEIMDDIL
jgi:hypothetical protein